VVDASECPPTFGVSFDLVVGLIAGGDGAIRKAVENAEDDIEQAWNDLMVYDVNELDTVVGIAASGRTPYVIGGLRTARENGLLTGAISCNKNSEISQEAEYPIEAIVGPEFVTGSTRMKAGTAQKLILNMISTSVMIQLGRVKGNKMVDMQLSNKKLIVRAENMVMKELGIERAEAEALLEQNGSVRESINAYRAKH
jgi:N-acetylmuramic acid 6-phosphate etherase